MLIEKYEKKISHSLLPVELITPFPKGSNREKWDTINKHIKLLIVDRAKRYNSFVIKQQKGTMLLDAYSSGDMSEIVKMYHDKINALTSFTLAECVGYKGEYTKKALDVAWSILDMAIWYVPQCTESGNDDLCDVTKYIVDDLSTEIAYALSYTYYLLEDQFDLIDINIGKRFKYEIEKRIMFPFMNEKEIDEKTVCNINKIIFPFLLFEDDYVVRHKVIDKAMRIMDVAINLYINEKKLTCQVFSGVMRGLDILNMASGGVFDLFDETVICKMSEIVSENKLKNISLLKYADYTSNNKLMKKAFSLYSPEDYIKMLSNELPLDDSLYTIFNYELIKNKFYMTEENNSDEVHDVK